MLKDLFMEFYVNPIRLKHTARAAVPILALCLSALIAAAPARAQQHADALKAALSAPASGTATDGHAPLLEGIVDRQHLPTPLVGRVPAQVLRAAAGDRDRRTEQMTMDDILNTLTAPRGRSPHVTAVTTAPVTSTVQTSDITYPGYTFNSQGVLQGMTPSNVDPFFSTTERYIYFVSNRISATDPAPGGIYHLWAISPSGSTTSLVQLTGLSTQPTISAAGEPFVGERYPSVVNDTSIAYAQEVRSATGATHFDLYVASLGTNGLTGVTQVTGLARHPDNSTYQLYQTLNVAHPSYVNGQIAFAGTTLNADETPLAGATSHIYLVSLGASQATDSFTQVTTGPAYDENPALSPDQPIVAFDSNVSGAGYTRSGSATTGELVSAGIKATNDIWLVQAPSGAIVNQFTNTSVTGTAFDNVQPAWSQPTTNPYFNNAGANLYLFFSSKRNNSVFDIYFLRAQDTTPTPPNGQLVVDLEGQDNHLIGTNIAAQVNTSSPLHHTNDALMTPINNFQPTISTLNSVLSVIYISNRYLINNVSDNPLDPGSELSQVGKQGYPALPASAQDNEPTSLTTNAGGAAQSNTELLASRLVDIDPPTLLPYDTSTGEVIHVEDLTAQVGKATRQVGAGSTAQFIVRLSDRQTGIGKAFLQIKDPNSKYQQASSSPLEHKVYTRHGGPLAQNANYTMHLKENDESTTLFELDNSLLGLFPNFSFGLNTAFYPGAAIPLGDQVYGASLAGASIATGGLLAYPRTYPQVNTSVTAVASATSITVNATSVIDDFATGDTLLFTSTANPVTHTPFPLSLTGIVNNQNGTYTFTVSPVPGVISPAAGTPTAGDTVIVEDTPVQTTVATMAGGGTPPTFSSLQTLSASHFQIGDTVDAGGILMVLNGLSGPASGKFTFNVSLPNGQPVPGALAIGALVQVVARFDPQGQEVDCEAIDGISYQSGGAPIFTTVNNFTVPVFTPGYEDATPLDGAATLANTPDVDTQTGPINRASGNNVWLQLTPFQASSSVAVATAAGATVLPVANTSGIVPGDTVLIGTEQAVVASLAVAAQQTGIPNGTPELIFDISSPLGLAHAVGESVTLVSSPSGGVLYEATMVTPTTPSDFFIDAIAFDNAAFPLTSGDGVTTPFELIGSNYNFGQLNWRIYDNIWGFSTLPFTPSSGPAVLVVSDYALPQKFFKGRFGTSGLNNLPFTYFGAESYLTDIEVDSGLVPDYLTGIVSDSTGNYGGASHAVTPSYALFVGSNTGKRGIIGSSAVFNGLANGPLGYPNGLGVNSYLDSDQSNIAVGDTTSGALLPSSQRYDIWRILARGPIPSNILNAYGPTVTTQPDVADSGSHPVQVANDMVIWVSPFTGNQFSTLGTILDPNTQTSIETFLNAGGRFFIEGQDIGFALTGNTVGSTHNAFLTNYLKAQYLSDTSGFSTGAYLLSAGNGVKNVISNDAFRNLTGTRQHRGFTVENVGGIVNYLPPSATTSASGVSFQVPTISHTPFSLNIYGVNQAPKDDATTRTDGSMDDGYGDHTTNFNAPVQGNVDGISSVTPTSAGVIYQSADLAGTTPGTTTVPPTGLDRLLYYFGNVPLTLTTSITGTLPAGTVTVPLAVPAGSSAAAVLNQFSPGDTFTLAGGANTETVIVKSSSVGSTGVPAITLAAGTAKTYTAGATLTRTASTDFTNFVGFSSFGLEAISQQMVDNTPFTSMNSVVSHFSSANQRTNLIHNLICTTRTGTITGLVTNTAAPQPGVLVEAQITDVITGANKTYTAISDSTGQYTMAGVLPGLYSFTISGGYVGVHQVLSTYVHGGDTLHQDIQVNPAPTGSVVVTVTDTFGNPVGGVQVTLTEIHGAFTYTGTTAATTNVNTGTVAGQVTFPTVAPSLYTITYVKPGYDVANPVQSPPNLVTVTQGTPLQVSTVLSPAPATVYGLVTSVGGAANGQPLQGVTITFNGPTGQVVTTTSGPNFNGPDGSAANYPLNDATTFTLPATPAGITYTFTATLAGYVPVTSTITVTSGEVVRLNLPVFVAGNIQLVVINSVTGLPIATPVTATVTAPGGTTTTVVSGGAAVVVLPNTAPGYTVTLPAAEGGASQTLPVAAGSTVTFTFIVTPPPGTVTGTVTDLGSHAPIAGAVVTLTTPGRAAIVSAPTGANGVYTIPNVPSGLTYTATATATNFTSSSVAGLSVSPSATVTQNFALASIFGTVTGSVTDSVSGAGVPGAVVTLTSGMHVYTATTSAAGTYVISNVLGSASPYTATVTAPEYITATRAAIVVPADGSLALNFVLVSTVIHHYPAGLQMFSAPFDYTGKALASILSGEVSKTTGLPINLVAAWVTLSAAYALTPTAPCETLHIGQGYWARFGATGGILMTGGTAATAATTSVPLYAGWNMIGNPYPASTLVSALKVQDSAGNTPISFVNASSSSVNFVNPQLYTYNTAGNAYTLLEINNPYGGTATPSLDPYAGYWIYAYTNCTLVFTKPQ